MLAVLACATPTHPHAAPHASHAPPDPKLTRAEKLGLLALSPLPGVGGGAVYQAAGVPRLGLPTLRFDPARDVGSVLDPATIAASWDPALAHRAGDLAARIARAQGIAQMATGMVDLVPVSFAQAGVAEDPLLAGTLAGEAASAMQAAHVMPVVGLPARTAPSGSAASANDARLAVQAVAVAASAAPGAALLCPDLQVAGRLWCDGAAPALSALRGVDAVDGAMLAAPGAVSSARQALAAGIDMGTVADGFGPALADALPATKAGMAALDGRVRRVLRSWRAAGVIDHPAPFHGDDVSLPAPLRAEQLVLRGQAVLEGAVLLRDRNRALPLAAPDTRQGQPRRPVLVVGEGALAAPAAALARALVLAGEVDAQPADPAKAAPDRAASLVVLFDGRHDSRVLATLIGDAAGNDIPVVALCVCTAMPDLALADDSDALAVTWGWQDEDAAPLARLLLGHADFSGRLPASWPLPGEPPAGYQTRDATHRPALYPFGFGLSLSAQPALSDLHVRDDGARLHVVFTLTNPADQPEIAVPQIYLDRPAGTAEPPKRLAGWRRVPLAAHQSQQIGVDVPLLMRQRWDQARQAWCVDPGVYSVSLGWHEADLPVHVPVGLAGSPSPESRRDAPSPSGQIL